MTKKTKHGGSRPNSGRKPVKDKKVSLFLWLPESVIVLAGGPGEAKRIGEAAVNKAAKNKS